MTIARLEKQERWELYDNGTPKWARLLCGKRNRHGAQRCSGPIAYVHFRDDGWPDYLLLEGMKCHSDGVYRPTGAGRRVYRRAGVLTEPDVILGEAPGQSHLIRQRQQQLEERIIPLIPPPAKAPRAACPRCKKEQDLLDADDLDSLRNAVIE